jgi:hypothetical protein
MGGIGTAGIPRSFSLDLDLSTSWNYGKKPCCVVGQQRESDCGEVQFGKTIMLERMNEKIVQSMFETMPMEISAIRKKA